VYRCSALLISGQHSIFNTSTRSLHQAITKTCADKTKVEFIEVIGVANVVEEKVFALLIDSCRGVVRGVVLKEKSESHEHISVRQNLASIFACFAHCFKTEVCRKYSNFYNGLKIYSFKYFLTIVDKQVLFLERK